MSLNVPDGVQPGDFFCLGGLTSDVAKLVALGEFIDGDKFALTRGREFIHAGVCVAVPRAAQPVIVEAEPGGARKVPWHYGDNSPAIWSTGVMEPLSRGNVVGMANSLVGTPYGWLDYAAIAARRLHLNWPGLQDYINSTGSLICSALVAVCWVAGMTPLFPGRWPGYATPQQEADLLMSKGAVALGGITRGHRSSPSHARRLGSWGRQLSQVRGRERDGRNAILSCRLHRAGCSGRATRRPSRLPGLRGSRHMTYSDDKLLHIGTHITSWEAATTPRGEHEAAEAFTREFAELNAHLRDGGDLPADWALARLPAEYRRSVLEEFFGTHKVVLPVGSGNSGPGGPVPDERELGLSVAGGVTIIATADLRKVLQDHGHHEPMDGDNSIGRMTRAAFGGNGHDH